MFGLWKSKLRVAAVMAIGAGAVIAITVAVVSAFGTDRNAHDAGSAPNPSAAATWSAPEPHPGADAATAKLGDMEPVAPPANGDAPTLSLGEPPVSGAIYHDEVPSASRTDSAGLAASPPELHPAPDAGVQLEATDPGFTSTKRDVSGLSMFQPQISGAMFEYEIPTTEELLELGYLAGGASPTHIAFLGTPVAGSVRCEWHPSVMTNGQREGAIRFMLGYTADQAMPNAAELQTTFDSFTALVDVQYRDAMRANFNHLVDGGVLDDSLVLACYVNYRVNQYLLGAGPSTITVAYDRLAKARSYHLYQLAHAAGRYGDDTFLTAEQYAAANAATVETATATINDAVMGRRSVVFLSPQGAHSSIAVEAWQAVAQWDVQSIDGTDTAVRFGAHENDREYSQPLEAFKTRIATAAASDSFAGQRITSIAGLTGYYRQIGAYSDITPNDDESTTFVPDQPPRACAGRVIANPASSPGLVADCRTLLAVKATLAGSGALNWSEDIPIADWDGLAVSGNPGRVTYLRLPGQGLNGSIPPELGELTGLTRILLSSNQLTGPVPGELGRLTNLRLLWLSGNDLSGEVPPQLGNLTQLRQLLLEDNGLTGTIPPQLGAMSNLETLWLHRNDLSGEIPSRLGNLSRLRRLTLSGNDLTGAIPTELGNLSNLDSLWLRANMLTGQIPASLENLGNLRQITLSENSFTGCIPPGLFDVEENDMNLLGLPTCAG